MEKSVEIARVSVSDVSISQIFKSSFARSFVSSYHDNKILDFDNFSDKADTSGDKCFDSSQKSLHQPEVTTTDTSIPSPEPEEQSLRKQCQVLTEENKRLQSALALQETSQFDSTYLQSQVDTLKWQLKQTESSRQMYRSLMKQVISFLERAQKSLDILHASNSTTSGHRSKSTTRNSRSQIIYPEDLLINSSASQRSVRSTSPSSGSKFARAKSVAQISSAHSSGFRDFTWSVLRRNDPSQSQSSSPSGSRTSKTTDHRSYTPQSSFNKSDGTISKSPESNSAEKIESDHIPPEKLSQEAFRLLRTAESLLAMREPDLSFSSSSSRNSSSSLTASAVTGDDENTSASVITDYGNTQSPDGSKSTNSINLDDLSRIEDSLSINRESDNRLSSFHKSSLEISSGNTSTLQPFSKSFDCASLNSSSSKTEEEERHSISFSVNIQNNINDNISSNDKNTNHIMSEVRQFTSTPNCTINRRAKYKSGTAETKDQRDSRLKEKPTSISSAEDESGFSSLNSFQDVGLPQLTARPATPVKPVGYHSEVGLPDVPLDRVNHRRWSSTPAEIQAMFRRYKNTYLSNQSSNAETLSVWV